MSRHPYPQWLMGAIECTMAGQPLPPADLPKLAEASRRDFESLERHLNERLNPTLPQLVQFMAVHALIGTAVLLGAAALVQAALGHALPAAVLDELPWLVAAGMAAGTAVAHWRHRREEAWLDQLRSQLNPVHAIAGLDELVMDLCERPGIAGHVRSVQAQCRSMRVVDVLAVQLHDWPDTPTSASMPTATAAPAGKTCVN